MSYDKIAKQLENPSIKLDTLARYAQGQNPAVPEFLALAEIKRRQSLVAHSPAPAQTTVQEDLTRSAMPQPMGLAGMQRPQGVAALQSGMGEQSFAGGGIVAFDGANGSLVEEDQDAGLSSFEKFRKYLNSLGGGVMPRGGAPVNALPGQVQAVRSGKGSGMPMTSEQVKAMMPADSIQGDESKLFEAEALAKKIAPKGEALPTVGEKGRMAPTTEETKPKEDMYAKYEEMLKGQAAESKAARDQDKYMRLLEAGLGIMGGTSQYALQNIGQGAMGAAKGYAQDKASYRKEDRENIKELMGLGMKREEAEREAKKLAIQEKYYGQHGDLYKAQADYYRSGKAGAAGAGANTRLTIAQMNLAQKYFKDLRNNMENSDISDAELQQRAMAMAGAQGGAAAPAPMTYNPTTRSFS